MRVPRFEPFAALRYTVDLDDVIAPPYDVVSEAEVDALAARDEHNIVHVDIPRERDGDERYEAAADRLRSWIDAGVMVADETPSLTLYRMRFTDSTGADRDIVGVMGGLEVVDEGAGGVLPHERTTPKASTDRLDLTRATRCNLSPIWGLSLAGGLTDLLTPPAEPMGSVTVDGVDHIVERLTDAERIAAIRDAIGSDDVLIADGHHRYGIARTYRDEVRRSTGSDGDPGRADARVRQRARRRPAQRRRHPPAVRRRPVSTSSVTASPCRSISSRPVRSMARPWRRWASAVRCASSTRRATAPGCSPSPARSTGSAPSTARGSSTRSATSTSTSRYQHGVDRVLDAVRSGRRRPGC